MFEHDKLDGKRHRVLETEGPGTVGEVLESREPQNGKPVEAAGRLQNAVRDGVCLERVLPPEAMGDRWPHDAVASPWWEVVSHPPHGGIVADFNEKMGGTYRRRLDPSRHVVAFAEGGEEVVLVGREYRVTRSRDETEVCAPSLEQLRATYYANGAT